MILKKLKIRLLQLKPSSSSIFQCQSFFHAKLIFQKILGCELRLHCHYVFGLCKLGERNIIFKQIYIFVRQQLLKYLSELFKTLSAEHFGMKFFIDGFLSAVVLVKKKNPPLLFLRNGWVGKHIVTKGVCQINSRKILEKILLFWLTETRAVKMLGMLSSISSGMKILTSLKVTLQFWHIWRSMVICGNVFSSTNWSL